MRTHTYAHVTYSYSTMAKNKKGKKKKKKKNDNKQHKAQKGPSMDWAKEGKEDIDEGKNDDEQSKFDDDGKENANCVSRDSSNNNSNDEDDDEDVENTDTSDFDGHSAEQQVICNIDVPKFVLEIGLDHSTPELSSKFKELRQHVPWDDAWKAYCTKPDNLTFFLVFCLGSHPGRASINEVVPCDLIGRTVCPSSSRKRNRKKPRNQKFGPF